MLHAAFHRRSDINYDLAATKRPFQISIKPLSLPTAISKEIYIIEEGCRFLKSQDKCFYNDERTKVIIPLTLNYLMRGHGFNQLDFIKALSDFLKVLELGDRDADSYHQVALVYSNLNNIEAAIEYNQLALTTRIQFA